MIVDEDRHGRRSVRPRSRIVLRWTAVVLFAVSGVVLLVAEKTAAGVSCVVAALILALPLRAGGSTPRVQSAGKVLRRARFLAVAVLLAVVVQSVAGTDVRPEQRRTGIAAVDKVAAIVQDFRETLTGNTTSGVGGKPAITEETVRKLTECMREHGLPGLAEPRVDSDGVSFDFSSVTASQETIRAAQDACAYLVTEPS